MKYFSFRAKAHKNVSKIQTLTYFQGRVATWTSAISKTPWASYG